MVSFCLSQQSVCPSPGSSYEYPHGNTVVISNIHTRAQPVAELKHMQGFLTTQKPVFKSRCMIRFYHLLSGKGKVIMGKGKVTMDSKQ